MVSFNRMNPPKFITPELIGKRIARLRSERGWTQQGLAGRLAVSRVAISHIEMDLTIPSERTITLLAGIFKMAPYDLVENTTYPQAKAEKLPLTACSYTQIEVDLALLESDLDWLKRLDGLPVQPRFAQEVRAKWGERMANLAMDDLDPTEREQVSNAIRRLEETCTLAERRTQARAPLRNG